LLDYIRRGNAKARTQNNRRAILCTFFKYACVQGWLAANPLAAVKRCRVDHWRGSAPAITSKQAAELMAHVETVHGGALVPFFALCLFAGIRPSGEISKLSAADVSAENASIIIEPRVSKVNMRRLLTIQPNLAAWLEAYPLDKFPIIPPKMKNFRGKLTRIRKEFKLAHDVLRHTFISMHVAKFRSMGDTALQAGNSEAIIRRHYLNVTTQQEANAFFNIAPRKKPEAKAAAATVEQQPLAA
jgi:integrase